MQVSVLLEYVCSDINRWSPWALYNDSLLIEGTLLLVGGTLFYVGYSLFQVGDLCPKLEAVPLYFRDISALCSILDNLRSRSKVFFSSAHHFMLEFTNGSP